MQFQSSTIKVLLVSWPWIRSLSILFLFIYNCSDHLFRRPSFLLYISPRETINNSSHFLYNFYYSSSNKNLIKSSSQQSHVFSKAKLERLLFRQIKRLFLVPSFLKSNFLCYSLFHFFLIYPFFIFKVTKLFLRLLFSLIKKKKQATSKQKHSASLGLFCS